MLTATDVRGAVGAESRGREGAWCCWDQTDVFHRQMSVNKLSTLLLVN